MSLKIESVVNGESPDAEYVRIKVLDTVNIEGYAIVDRTFDAKGNLSNEFRHIFVFPSTVVEKGDWIRLYSGKNAYKAVRNLQDTASIHKFYWGADNCVWNNNGGDRATLIRYSVIDGVDVPALDQ